MTADYLMVCTFTFQIIFTSTMLNWVEVTEGARGVTSIPPVHILGLNFGTKFGFLLLSAIFVGLTFLVVRHIVNSPFGRVLRGMREDEVACEALGKNVVSYRILSFMISGGLASIGGSLFAHYIAFVDPFCFTIHETVFIMTIIIIGGIGTLWGGIIGSAILVGMPEIFRFMGIPAQALGPILQIFYGVLVLLFVLFRPQGIIGEKLIEE
jgi:branched-chain amino acid transport system permease protein